jgi:hypothetical protein
MTNGVSCFVLTSVPHDRVGGSAASFLIKRFLIIPFAPFLAIPWTVAKVFNKVFGSDHETLYLVIVQMLLHVSGHVLCPQLNDLTTLCYRECFWLPTKSLLTSSTKSLITTNSLFDFSKTFNKNN